MQLVVIVRVVLVSEKILLLHCQSKSYITRLHISSSFVACDPESSGTFGAPAAAATRGSNDYRGHCYNTPLEPTRGQRGRIFCFLVFFFLKVFHKFVSGSMLLKSGLLARRHRW